MTDLLVETVGWVGAAALLLGYGLVSAGRLDGRSTGFQVLNLVGSAGLLINGVWHDAWPSAALNAVWLVIGLMALGRLRRWRRPGPKPARRGPLARRRAARAAGQAAGGGRVGL